MGTSQQQHYHLSCPDRQCIIKGQHIISIQQPSGTMTGFLQQMTAWSLPTNCKSSSWFHELGMSYNATGTHRSAISAIVEIPRVSQVVECWLVSQFMKGIFHLRFPQPRYTNVWDFNEVLSHLKSLGPHGLFCLKQLTLKTAQCIYAYLAQRS